MDFYVVFYLYKVSIELPGGENISSLEVEDTFHINLPSLILTCPLLCKTERTVGKLPCAFMNLKLGASITPEESTEALSKRTFCSLKFTKVMVITEIQKTSTGIKLQKFI